MEKDALKKMEAHHDIMAVLLDLRMPVMDGYEFLRVVRMECHNDTLPIIAITAMEGDSSEIQALNLGADDYLVKPVVPSVVRKKTRKMQSDCKGAETGKPRSDDQSF